MPFPMPDASAFGSQAERVNRYRVFTSSIRKIHRPATVATYRLRGSSLEILKKPIEVMELVWWNLVDGSVLL